MIDSKAITLADVLTTGTFIPASVQRQYQWQSKQITELLDDLMGAFQSTGMDPGEAVAETDPEAGQDQDEVADEPLIEPDQAQVTAQPKVSKRLQPDIYFLGAMYLYKAPRAVNYVVYDGLQRLTTLNLMLAKLRDSWGAIPEGDAALIRQWLFADQKQRLDPQSPGKALELIIGAGIVKPGKLSDGDRKMAAAAELLDKRFDKTWDSRRRGAFLQFLKTKVYLSITEVRNPTVAYQMFNGANARGLRLTVADNLKGHFAQQIRDAGGTLVQVTGFNTIWRDAEISLRNSFTPFIHALEIYLFRPPNRHTTGEHLEGLFEEKTPAADILTWFETDFRAHVTAMERTRKHLHLGACEDTDLAFRQLSFIDWLDWLPYVLALRIAHGGRMDSVAFKREIQDLQRACYMAELLEWPDGTRRSKFLAAIRERESTPVINPFTQPRGVAGAPGKAGSLCLKSARMKRIAKLRLRQPLTTDEKRGALVRWIETLHWGARVPNTVTDDATVEHILPITARGEWQTWFTDAEREAWTHRLGNLCLIDEEVNQRIGSSPWDVKALEFAKLDPALKPVKPSKGATLVLAAGVAAVAVGKQPWSVETISARDETLAKLAEAALKI